MATMPDAQFFATPAARSTCARWGAIAGAAGMISWIVGVALIPLDAKLDSSGIALTAILASNAPRLYLAALLAVTGGVLLTTLLVALSRLVSEGATGSLLQVALAACIITQTMVAVGAVFALVALHSAVAGLDAALVALCWRGLWLSFLASGVPTILFTIAAVVGLERAGLTSPVVSLLGWISAAAHTAVLFTLAQQGLFAPDGLFGLLAPVTTYAWILTLCAQLPGRVRVQPVLSS